MVKNTLGDLNNHLFAQLERLNDEELDEKALATEIERAKAISEVAKNIVANGQLALNVQRYYDNPDRLNIDAKKPKMLEMPER